MSKGDVCGECRGEKVAEERKIINVYIDKGMENGQKLSFAGEADEAPGVEPGDVIVVLQARDHARFTRDGDDLRTTVRVPLVEALVSSLEVAHLVVFVFVRCCAIEFFLLFFFFLYFVSFFDFLSSSFCLFSCFFVCLSLVNLLNFWFLLL